MQTEFSLTQKNASGAKCDDQWAFWCRRLWRNKWPYFHWETPRVGSYCCSRDVLEPGLGDNHKYKLTDNSHLASSETGMITENGSCEKRAITSEHNCMNHISAAQRVNTLQSAAAWFLYSQKRWRLRTMKATPHCGSKIKAADDTTTDETSDVYNIYTIKTLFDHKFKKNPTFFCLLFCSPSVWETQVAMGLIWWWRLITVLITQKVAREKSGFVSFSLINVPEIPAFVDPPVTTESAQVG